MNVSHNKDVKPPVLQAAIVEPILKLCINGITMDELKLKTDKMLPLMFMIAKKYLFYLINYDLVSYDGQKRIFTIKDDGYDLLSEIKNEKSMLTTNINNLIITFKYDYVP